VRLPIDTSALTFQCSKPAEPVLDYDNKKQPKVDQNGEPLFSIQVVAFGEDGANIMVVKFPGSPPMGIKPGVPLKLTGLVVSDWTVEGKYGLSFRASKVEPMNSQVAKGGAA
jgi:hypothetical protein